MVMKCVCTHNNKEQAQNAADSLKASGCETEVYKTSDGKWGVKSDGMFATRTVMEKF